MKVSEIMRRKGTRIITVRMSETVETAARLMRRENIGAVVVKDVCGTEGDVVLGMFSERDVLRAIVDQGVSALKLPVSALMSRDVIACGPHDDIAHVTALMDDHHVRHLPVLDEHTLVGVISIRDVIAFRASVETGLAPHQQPDEPRAAHPH
jgi:CBS domain-containing protein